MHKPAPAFPMTYPGATSSQSAQARRPVLWGTLLGAACVLAGCATYQPLPLERHDTSLHVVRQLLLNHQRVQLPGLAPHPLDPSQPLDMTDVATLAVVGNPELKLARDDAGLTHAQAFAAGLLPDPQIALSQDFPGKPGLVSAFNRGLSFDFGSLITLEARRNAGAAEGSKADLALLWQEWQVVAQARKQFIGITFLERATGVLQQSLVLTEQRVYEARQAVDSGNATLDSLSPYLVAQADAQRQFDAQTRQLRQARYALNALLGLAPEVHLDLAVPPPQPAIDTQAVRRALQDLPERRPDLLALAAGYQAQEERLRAAVLAQFPSPNIGFTRARDTSAVYTSGFTLGISLPIFNRNRGNIAIETATRQRLHDEYQSRVNAAYAEVAQILDDQRLLDAQERAAAEAVASLTQAASAADIAYRAHNMTLTAYVDLQSALLAKRRELLELQRTDLEQRIALQTLLGGAVPQAEGPRPPHSSSYKDAK